jgi:hypothetical protein
METVVTTARLRLRRLIPEVIVPIGDLLRSDPDSKARDEPRQARFLERCHAPDVQIGPLAFELFCWAGRGCDSLYMSPMSVRDPDQIDLVAQDPDANEAILVLIENRDFGPEGSLLPELQTKLNTYLNYVGSGQMRADYPQTAGQSVRFELITSQPLGQLERSFLRDVIERFLDPFGIRFGWRVMGDADRRVI